MIRVAFARLAATSLAFCTRVYGRGLLSYKAFSMKSPTDLPSSGSGCTGVTYRGPDLALFHTDSMASYLATLFVLFSYEEVPFPTRTLWIVVTVGGVGSGVWSGSLSCLVIHSAGPMVTSGWISSG
jgi:hypothetical protein